MILNFCGNSRFFGYGFQKPEGNSTLKVPVLNANDVRLQLIPCIFSDLESVKNIKILK